MSSSAKQPLSPLPRAKLAGAGDARKRSGDATFEKKKAEIDQARAKVKAEIDSLHKQIESIKGQIEDMHSKDSNVAARAELHSELQRLKASKEALIESKAPNSIKISDLLDQIAKKNAEIEGARENLVCKRPEDLHKKISEMEHLVEAGTLKLNEENRLLSEITKLRKSIKSFDGINVLISGRLELEKQVDTLREAQKKIDHELSSVTLLMKSKKLKLNELDSIRGSTASVIQKLKSQLADLYSQLQKKRQLRDEIHEASNKAFQDHQAWIAAKNAKMEAQTARLKIEDEIYALEEEMAKLHIPSRSKEMASLDHLESFLASQFKEQSSSEKGKRFSPGRPVEKLKEGEFVILNKKDKAEEELFYFGLSKTKKSSSKSSPSSASPSIGKLPGNIVLELEILGAGPVSSQADVQRALDLISKHRDALLLKEKEKFSSVEATRAEISEKMEQLKQKLVLVSPAKSEGASS